MKRLFLILAVVGLSGCAAIKEYIPSRWDVNQSRIVTDIQQSTRNFDCKADLSTQTKTLVSQIEWLDIYSQTKGTVDVSKLTSTIKETSKELQDRLTKGPVSPLYCDLKKKILIQQADIIATTVQGRF